jgi:hypothetical protein
MDPEHVSALREEEPRQKVIRAGDKSIAVIHQTPSDMYLSINPPRAEIILNPKKVTALISELTKGPETYWLGRKIWTMAEGLGRTTWAQAEELGRKIRGKDKPAGLLR